MASLLIRDSTTELTSFPCLKLRDDLEDLSVPNDNSVPQNRRFFPRSSVKRLCTEGWISSALHCCCLKCREHRQTAQRPPNSPYYYAAIIGENKSSRCDSGRVGILFALCVCSECPSLIYSFIDKGITDDYFENHMSQFTASNIRQKYWSSIHPRYSERFHWNKYRFATPFLKKILFDEYPSEIILPFLKESRLGKQNKHGEIEDEGSYGKVFAFEILDEYFAIPGFAGVRRFARKELHPDTSYEQFNHEYRNLLKVGQLQDDHIVKLVKAYRHGDCYNLVFPCAKTNLRLYLRQPQFHPAPRVSNVIWHPLWHRMLALARALHKVLHFESPTSTREPSFFGYHLDLKPANILVEESDDLVLTDFGQATFKQVVGSTSSKVAGRGGTEAYAPPEIDDKEARQSRRYDIWSFGGILLEACGFAVGGCEGVLHLDQLRSKKHPDNNSTDDRFFRRKNSNSYELKPEIKEWIELLPQALEGQERNFLNEVLSLALQMLHVDVSLRLTSKDVCIRFSEIIDRFQSDPQNGPGSIGFDAQSPRSGREIGKERMKDIPFLGYNIHGFWKSGPVRFVQDHTGLRVETLEGQTWKGSSLNDVSTIRLVPRYAFYDRNPHYYSDAHLYFYPPGQHKGKFSADNDRDIHLLQEILLGQEVRFSSNLKIAQARLKDRLTFSETFHRRRGSNLANQRHELEFRASSIQLWIDSSHRDIRDIITPTRPSVKYMPRSLRTTPFPSRIVIFYEQSILVVRIHNNVRISPSARVTESAAFLELIPTDKRRGASFPVSVFKTEPREVLPSLPLTRDKFELEEMDNSKECCCLTLEFHSTAQARSFHQHYKKIKRTWLEDLHKFEKLKGQIGPVLGYGQS